MRQHFCLIVFVFVFKATTKTFSFFQTLGCGECGNLGGHMNAVGSIPAVFNAKSNHTATIFFFHGLNDHGHGIARILHEDIVLPHVKVVCPNAAVRPISFIFRIRMRAWYDIRIHAWYDLFGFTEDSHEDPPEIQRAVEYVHDLINDEIKAGIPSERIVLAGMSMGGALAVYSGLTFDKPLAAIVGLSSWLLQRDKIPGDHKANLNTPIFLAHGTQDLLVPLYFGRKAHETISKFNPNSQFKSYPMSHVNCADEMKDFKEFLENILK